MGLLKRATNIRHNDRMLQDYVSKDRPWYTQSFRNKVKQPIATDNSIDPYADMYYTYDEWIGLGYHVVAGNKSHKRNKNNKCVFHLSQVERNRR